ncbi:hypothetical protein [Planktothricoides sp. SR001]|uniref:hypothetical protein n=1 Tax=Planktothricoides sp. SR001 TaxID=1705388 RepID=UPI0012E2465B|nr:hypothetical protein [Planktothricoides sp. SR001]
MSEPQILARTKHSRKKLTLLTHRISAGMLRPYKPFCPSARTKHSRKKLTLLTHRISAGMLCPYNPPAPLLQNNYPDLPRVGLYILVNVGVLAVARYRSPDSDGKPSSNQTNQTK